MCRGHRPVQCWPPGGKRLANGRFSQLSATHLQEAGHDPTDHLAKEGICRDVDRHDRSRPPDPDPVQGPDRLPVRSPEGPEVVAAHQGRPGSCHRGVVERDRTPSAVRSTSGLRGPFQTV